MIGFVHKFKWIFVCNFVLLGVGTFLMEKKKLAGLSSFRTINSLRNGIFYSFLVLYLREYLGLSVTEASLLTSLSEIIMSATQFLVWGPLSDRAQKRMPFIVGRGFPTNLFCSYIFLLLTYRPCKVSSRSKGLAILCSIILYVI